jgi:hypothetical protein
LHGFIPAAACAIVGNAGAKLKLRAGTWALAPAQRGRMPHHGSQPTDFRAGERVESGGSERRLR